MKIVTDEKLIKRNGRIGSITTIASLAVLGVGFYLAVTSTSADSQQNPTMFAIMWGTLIVGFVLSQVGIYYGNRWGRRPRPDEVLDAALKGMDDRSTLYHYRAPVHHVLVGPPGIWILLPYHQMGKVTYDAKKKRWQQKGGGFVQGYLRLFGQEGLGRPDLEVAAQQEELVRFFKKQLPDVEIPPIQAALVFTSTQATIDAPDAPHPTLKVENLKEQLNKAAKNSGMNPDKLRQLRKAFDE